MSSGRTHLYVRVSSRDQGERGTSLEEQAERLNACVAREGLANPTIRIEIESGGESKEEKRDEIQALLAEAKPGDTILVTRVDRWSRNVTFAVSEVRKLVARGIGWRAIDDGIDAATESGDVALGYQALAADHEHKRIRRRTVGARERLLAEGQWANAEVPFGYKRGDRASKRQRCLDVVEPDAEIIRRAFELCIAGRSLGSIAVALREARPDKTWSRAMLWFILKNRVYIGEVFAKDRWVQGKHAAIVDVATFVRVQEAKHARFKGGARATEASRTASWLTRGLLWCGLCGARMRSAYGRGRDYFACSDRCGAKFVRVEIVDAEIAQASLDRLSDLRVELGGKTKRSAVKVPDRGAVLARLEAKRARLVTGYVDGVLSAADVARERALLDAEQARLEASIASAAIHVASQSPESRRALLLNVEQLERAWSRAPTSARREILSRLAVKIHVEAGSLSRVEWRSVEVLIANKP